MTVKELWNRYVLRRKPMAPMAPVPVLTPDELAEKLVGQANSLFQEAYDARERAAETLESAARHAEERAESLRRQVEDLVSLATQRYDKARTSREVAAKLTDFIG